MSMRVLTSVKRQGVCVTYVHDAVFLRVEEQPVIEKSQLGIGGSDIRLETQID